MHKKVIEGIQLLGEIQGMTDTVISEEELAVIDSDIDKVRSILINLNDELTFEQSMQQ